MQTAERYFRGCEFHDPFALRWAHLPDLPPSPTRYWSYNKHQVAWGSNLREMRHHARLGDARLEYLVPLVLRRNYMRLNPPEVSICRSVHGI